MEWQRICPRTTWSDVSWSCQSQWHVYSFAVLSTVLQSLPHDPPTCMHSTHVLLTTPEKSMSIVMPSCPDSIPFHLYMTYNSINHSGWLSTPSYWTVHYYSQDATCAMGCLNLCNLLQSPPGKVHMAHISCNHISLAPSLDSFELVHSHGTENMN